jgi:hypothetical protein
MTAPDPVGVWSLYRAAQDRIVGLLDDGAAWEVRLPCCPLWTVRDVVAHLTAVAEDWVAGTLTGPPTDAETAAQVARFAGHDIPAVLAAWEAATERLHRHAAAGTAPPLGDIVSHEHDIRGALAVPGARDDVAVHQVADQLLDMLDTPVPLRVCTPDREYHSGPSSGTEITLHTDDFEALRWRTGRRSRTQMAAMQWSGDPAAVLDHLYLFGPAPQDIVE